MDLAGLAALLAIPIAAISAFAGPLKDRGLVARLQRIEKVLDEGTAAGLQRAMLENARDHLVERIAVAELRPRHVSGYISVACFITLGVLVVALVAFGVDGADKNPVNLRIGFGCYFLGLAIWMVISIAQHWWLVTNRTNGYRRDNNPLS